MRVCCSAFFVFFCACPAPFETLPAGEGEGEGEPITFVDAHEELPPALVDAVNAATVACVAAVPGDFAARFDPDGVLARDVAHRYFAPLQTLINDGAVTLDPVAVAACVDDLAAPRCIAFFPGELLHDGCSALTVGLAPVGAACGAREQCASFSCDCFCGDVVTPRVPINVDIVPCFSDSDCGAGDVCARTSEGSVCVPCAGDDCARVIGRAIGDACTTGADGVCPFGLACRDDTCQPVDVVDPCPDLGLCAEGEGGEGDACVSVGCSDGFVCDDGVCVSYADSFAGLPDTCL